MLNIMVLVTNSLSWRWFLSPSVGPVSGHLLRSHSELIREPRRGFYKTQNLLMRMLVGICKDDRQRWDTGLRSKTRAARVRDRTVHQGKAGGTLQTSPLCGCRGAGVLRCTAEQHSGGCPCKVLPRADPSLWHQRPLSSRFSLTHLPAAHRLIPYTGASGLRATTLPIPVLQQLLKPEATAAAVIATPPVCSHLLASKNSVAGA